MISTREERVMRTIELLRILLGDHVEWYTIKRPNTLPSGCNYNLSEWNWINDAKTAMIFGDVLIQTIWELESIIEKYQSELCQVKLER